MVKKSTILDSIDKHLANLDKVALPSDLIFNKKKKRDKERYETLLMYAYRKYQAAKYYL